MFREALGGELRERRTHLGLTLRAAAERVPMSIGYLSEVERGRKEISSEVLETIANVYEIPLSEIIINAATRLKRREVVEIRQNSLCQTPVIDFRNGKTVRRMAG